jgi:hypothetical protein
VVSSGTALLVRFVTGSGHWRDSLRCMFCQCRWQVDSPLSQEASVTSSVRCHWCSAGRGGYHHTAYCMCLSRECLFQNTLCTAHHASMVCVRTAVQTMLRSCSICPGGSGKYLCAPALPMPMMVMVMVHHPEAAHLAGTISWHAAPLYHRNRTPTVCTVPQWWSLPAVARVPALRLGTHCQEQEDGAAHLWRLLVAQGG